MNIMFLCHGAGNGGAERVITTLASEFSKRNYPVLLVTTKEAHNDYDIDKNVIRRTIEISARNVLLRTLLRIWELSKCIKSFKPDCIISFSAIPNIQILLASRFKPCKVIVSERTDPSKYPTTMYGRLLRNLVYPWADRIVFQTQEARQYFSEKIQLKSEIIFNPIREGLPERYRGMRENRIVGIGSLGEQKNWLVSLKACEIFFVEFPDYILEIYGEGPEKDILQTYIDNSMMLRNRVFLRGFSMDAVNTMNNARIYISSSNYEGISNAMLEALATGVPSICTDCPVGGAREFIVSGENGFLVPVGGVKEMAQAMMELAKDEMLCDRFSTNSVKICERLKLEKIVDKWEAVIKTVCSKEK